MQCLMFNIGVCDKYSWWLETPVALQILEQKNLSLRQDTGHSTEERGSSVLSQGTRMTVLVQGQWILCLFFTLAAAVRAERIWRQLVRTHRLKQVSCVIWWILCLRLRISSVIPQTAEPSPRYNRFSCYVNLYRGLNTISQNLPSITMLRNHRTNSSLTDCVWSLDSYQLSQGEAILLVTPVTNHQKPRLLNTA